jgi:TusA-related sulfurtransferase
MGQKIDVRGLSCPQPLLLIKKAIEAGENNFTVLADDIGVIENITRLLLNSGFHIETEKEGRETLLRISKME